MEEQNITRKTLVDSWKTYAIRLLMTVPQDGIAELDGRERRQKRTGSWVLWALIGVLAIASITNLADRAYTHKAGFSANVVGAGLALLVPVAVHYAIKVAGHWQYIVWGVAALFATISGTIQYQIYAPDGPFALSKDHLEALAFGAGVPLAECMLAAIAAIVVLQGEQGEAKRKATAEAAAAAERERVRLEAAAADADRIAEGERRARLEHELETKRKDDDARRENERIAAEAKAEATRIRAQKSVQRNVPPNVPNGERQNVLASGGTSREVAQRDGLLNYLRDNGGTGAKELQAATGMSKSALYRLLTQLAERGLVVNQDRKWDVVRDVAPALPEPPQIHLNGITHD